MKISRLISQRGKVNVFFDNGENALLRYDTVLKFGLKKNDEITGEKFAGMVDEDFRLQIKELSFKFLSRRMHSAAELKRKLILKKLPLSRIDEVISELIDKKYIDDKIFAEKYCEEKFKNNKTGLIKLKAELIQKGVDTKIAGLVLAKYENGSSILENALILARKKLESIQYSKAEEHKKKEKLFRFLTSKGYSREIIIKTLRRLNLKEDTDVQFD